MTEKKAPPSDVCAAIKKRLIRLGETYQREVTPEMFAAYIESLGDLTYLDVEIAFTESAKRRKFFPNPAEIREALELMRERFPAKKEEFSSGCKFCGGTGFKLLPHPHATQDIRWKDAKVAERCNHGQTTAT